MSWKLSEEPEVKQAQEEEVNKRPEEETKEESQRTRRLEDKDLKIKREREREEEMRTFQSQVMRRGASSCLTSLLNAASVSFTALMILSVPLCRGAPAELHRPPTEQRKLLSQVDAVCSSYFSAGHKFWASDVLGELCVSMLVQKSKELMLQELSKRAEVQGPGGVQSRGYFLYRVRTRP
uniref:Neuromedin U C-terminal domain-containing protein n=1 Tax=Gasterosteus aculeatus aculeatus TaxID=481459 RepID=A0AAQ4QLT6_GASAC